MDLRSHCNIHLFGWVIRYGKPCDQEDKEFFQFLISELSEDFLRIRTIVIVGEIQSTFEVWKDQQTGFFEHLHKICNKRILSFDNITWPFVQRNRLFYLIWFLVSNLPEEVTNYHLPSDRYTSSIDKQYLSKLSRVRETDRRPLRRADDRSKSKLCTHSPEFVECKDWRMLFIK
ncbi:hypothetical protein PoB_001915800 [Plakobranchus ocellatus]|uniref:Uncharacterized protein n=1 Tax=Plakobranchus ocellatus TaxID=259542 RepID=A0AAV3ZDK3_9GAST|nr:hypothetical protein PoB_001915800 [Plakobranchus ocellatus]